MKSLWKRTSGFELQLLAPRGETFPLMISSNSGVTATMIQELQTFRNRIFAQDHGFEWPLDYLNVDLRAWHLVVRDEQGIVCCGRAVMHTGRSIPVVTLGARRFLDRVGEPTRMHYWRAIDAFVESSRDSNQTHCCPRQPGLRLPCS